MYERGIADTGGGGDLHVRIDYLCLGRAGGARCFGRAGSAGRRGDAGGYGQRRELSA
jgi:hypothetical protein